MARDVSGTVQSEATRKGTMGFESELGRSAQSREALEEDLFQKESAAQIRQLRLLYVVAVFAAFSDALFSLVTHNAGVIQLTPMAEANGVSLILLLAGFCIFRWHGLVAGKLAYYFAVLIALAGHAFWVGYGLSSPGLAFLAILIIQESLGPRATNIARALAVTSTALVVAIGAAQASAVLKPVPVPLFHQLVVMAALFGSAYLLGRLILTSRHAIWSENLDSSASLIGLNDRLNQALLARNSFFSAISHEIRTPLHGISSAISLLKHPRATPETKERSMTALEKSVHDAGKIIDDVLDLSRLESGGFSLEREPVDLRQLCIQQMDFFKAAADEKNTRLELNQHCDGVAMVWADGLRLRQMLSNLLSNAIKFTSAGHICVSVQAAQCDSNRGNYTFSVADTSCGIDSNSLSRLFEPFVQGRNQKDSNRSGSGLGLSIVAGLAKQIDGSVGATSVVGKGSTFWFTVQLELCEAVS